MAVAILPALAEGDVESSSQSAVHYHCAGGLQLSNDLHLPTLHKVLVSPTTTKLLNRARTRLACSLTNSLRLGDNSSAASLIEPLLSDVVGMESLGTFGGASANADSFILALHLDASGAQLWQDNLGTIFGGSGDKFTSQEFAGQRWNGGGSNSIWIIPAQDWLLVGRGEDFAAAQAQYLTQIKAKGRPVPALEHNWLEADLTSDRLGGWFQLLQPARLHFAVAPDEDKLLIAARILTTDDIRWKSAPWQVPKDLIRGQIISFTAGENVAAFLKMNPALSQLAGDPLTNQFYFWALDQMPLLNYMAWPEANASNTLERLSAQAPPAFNSELKNFDGTELVRPPQGNALVLRNIRLFVPALQAVEGSNGQFLFLSSFPRAPNAKPAPDALLSQIEGRTNLVYYDWELTGRRMQEWQILGKMIANRALAQTSHAQDDELIDTEWLSGLGSLPGNTVTEITRVAPNELSVMRKAPIGFTAVELDLLAAWICEANTGPIHAPQAGGLPFPPPGR
jgi:hypothetical protein